jgi:hypothetical protein
MGVDGWLITPESSPPRPRSADGDRTEGAAELEPCGGVPPRTGPDVHLIRLPVLGMAKGTEISGLTFWPENTAHVHLVNSFSPINVSVVPAFGVTVPLSLAQHQSSPFQASSAGAFRFVSALVTKH